MVSYIRGDDNFDSANTGPSSTAGAVGTYASLWYNGSTSQGAGADFSGSNLRWGNFGSLGYAYNVYGRSGNAPSGTWRLMGQMNSVNGSNYNYGSEFFNGAVFLRIS